jgi:hypothetical protein
MSMMRRSTRHEVRTQRAHLRAVEQGDQMLRFGMMAASMKKVGDGLGADAVTIGAVGDAPFHRRAGLNHVISP